ncbi:hypothetical protein NW765_015362 [Fusarium oxysporum]|nr:hypothetical protein NW765_015362 [Fusarium oxysporum]
MRINDPLAEHSPALLKIFPSRKVKGQKEHLPPRPEIVTVDSARHTVGQQDGEVMPLSLRAEPQNLIRDRTGLNGDILLFTKLHQQWMLENAEAMSNALGSKQDIIKQVCVSVASMVLRLTSMEDKGKIEPQLINPSSHIEKLRNPIRQRLAGTFLACKSKPTTH